jgi:diguanylate cyclase (GGDEF)-like protein
MLKIEIRHSFFAILLIMFVNRAYAEKTSESQLLGYLEQAESIRILNLNKAIEYLEPKKQYFVESENFVGLTEYHLYMGFYNIAIGKFAVGESFMDQAETIINKHKIPEQQADLMFFRAMLAQKNSDVDNAIKLFLQHYDFAEKHNLVTNQIYSKVHLNQLFISQGNALGALTHLKDAYQLLPNIKPQKWKRTVALRALVAGSMGAIYTNLGETEKAIKFYNEAANGFSEFNSMINAGVVITNLASVYANLLNDYDQAIVEYEKAYAIASRINNERLKIIYFQGMGRVYFKTNKFEQAEIAYENALKIALKRDLQKHINSSRLGLSEVYIKLDNLDRAIFLLEEIEPYYARFELNSTSYDIHRMLQEIFFKKKDIEKAYFHQSKALALYQLNQNEESSNALARVRTEMDIELNEVQQRLLAKEYEVVKLNNIRQKTSLDSQNQLLLLSTGLIFLLLIITFVLVLFSRKLHRLATTDPMTNLANRRRVFEFANKAFDKALKRKEDFSVVVFDLDRFKRINDTFGHEMGDGVIIAVSDICKQLVREGNLIGRLGGEEFIVVLPNLNGEKAVEIAEAMRLGIADYDWKSMDSKLSVTSSFGVACLTERTDDIDGLIRISDDALYHAKDAGRNTVIFERDRL